MQTAPLGTSELALPVVAVGCMRLRQLDLPAAERFQGLRWSRGRARTLPGAGHARSGSGGGAPDPDPSRHAILPSQCGIRLGAYDVSRERVLVSVEGSLLPGHGSLDVLRLHRPDALVEPEEVAEAFVQRAASGKVQPFGVSNRKAHADGAAGPVCPQPLAANQIPLCITNAAVIAQG